MRWVQVHQGLEYRRPGTQQIQILNLVTVLFMLCITTVKKNRHGKQQKGDKQEDGRIIWSKKKKQYRSERQGIHINIHNYIYTHIHIIFIYI